MKKIALLCATTAFVLPGIAMAQSTGTITTEEETTVVVTGTRTRDVNGISIPDRPKAQGVLNSELIQRQAPGQSILQTVNLVPGVNFTNSDAYGSSGGNLRIRGFDGNRISLTFDGVPLNDSGNYAIFSNQQMDPELIEQVNVNLGQTDIDSPTASASGGTVNYRTILPNRNFGIRATGSVGEDSYRRGHIQLHSGEWWENGPRAFLAYSNARNDWFRGPGEIYKQQLNARIYYPIGNNGDFVSVAGHYNRNRNNFSRNIGFTDLRTTALPDGTLGLIGSVLQPAANLATPSLVGSYTDQEWDRIIDGPINNFATCNLPSHPGNAGVIENDNGGTGPNGTGANATGTTNNIANSSSCTNYTGLRINPSNTGNIRINGRFTLADNLILTVDPSFQYVRANGGGTTLLSETDLRLRGATPLNAGPGIAGKDLNGDGDILDNVRFYTPNNTNTRRFGLTSSLIWSINEDNRIRVAYTFDRAKHRQTGEWGFIDANGDPESVFGGLNATPVLDVSNFQFQQRDRRSIASLHQVAAQYVGNFFEDRFRVEVGVRMPFFHRDLETFCPVQATDGFAYCTSQPILARGSTPVIPGGTGAGTIPIYVNVGDCVATSCGLNAAYRPLYAAFAAEYDFSPILPNVGLVWNFGGGLSVFASYAKGFSAPRTDNLYRAPVVTVDPETTNAFDLGLRYVRRNVIAQAAVWNIGYKNRIVTSFDQAAGISVDRNVGSVHTWGADASLGWEPIPELSLYAMASYNHSRLQNNVNLAAAPGTNCDASPNIAGCAQTAGKRVAETPDWTFGGRAQANLGPFTIGAQAKWVDERFATDDNSIVVDDYTTIDIDVRFDLGSIGLPDSYVQFNAINLLNENYFGNISTQINGVATGTAGAANPNFSVGAPQTFLVTLNLAWFAGH
jgi:iron complex outermembrane receptor protein